MVESECLVNDIKFTLQKYYLNTRSKSKEYLFYKDWCPYI